MTDQEECCYMADCNESQSHFCVQHCIEVFAAPAPDAELLALNQERLETAVRLALDDLRDRVNLLIAAKAQAGKQGE